MQFTVVREKERNSQQRDFCRSSIWQHLLHFVSASVPSRFATPGVVELALLSSGDEIFVLDEQLIQRPKPHSVRERVRDRIMKALREQAALFETISYPDRAMTLHSNTPLIHLCCFKAFHHRMDFSKTKLKRACPERPTHKEERSSSAIRVPMGL
jgi:hypothetical protein